MYPSVRGPYMWPEKNLTATYYNQTWKRSTRTEKRTFKSKIRNRQFLFKRNFTKMTVNFSTEISYARMKWNDRFKGQR